ncbi:MAG: 3-isopropylmalate dehydratase small subunit [Candidatus Pacebacteria bacterium]|nr:3-isopropylmalate dehydratase small subunit [Candidatus Paceibacterota bacterium]
MPTEWGDSDFTKPNYSKYAGTTGKSKYEDFSGKVFYLNVANINTDHIIPAKYLTEVDKKVFGQHCLEDAPISAEHRQRLFGSQIIVARENFGCGSSREHAVWAFDGIGVKCIIAPSFARIFENNMLAIGLLCITLPKDKIEMLFEKKQEELSIRLDFNTHLRTGSIIGREDVCVIGFQLSDYQRELIEKGGSIGAMLEIAAELQKEGKL